MDWWGWLGIIGATGLFVYAVRQALNPPARTARGRQLKQAVASVLEGVRPEHWHEGRIAVVGFDQRDAEGNLIGRMEGYVTLFNGTTPEQYIKSVRRG